MNIKILYILLIASSLCFQVLQAQLLQPISFPVTIDDKNLAYPFAGGLQAPQFSQVDLNRDGLPDLFVFDRVGDISMAFINNGDNTYRIDNSYLNHFPEMREWATLIDYNKDGTPDLFTYSIGVTSGIRVFMGFWEGNKLAFEQKFWPDQSSSTRDVLEYYSKTTNRKVANIYVFNVDKPAFYDVDGDGDLDILSFDNIGFRLSYYQNRSVEFGHGTDSLIFYLEDNCWGKFFESGVSPALDLSDDPEKCYQFLDSETITDNRDLRHAGSTVLALDATGNGLTDVLLGDISFDQLVLAKNGGTVSNAWINDQDINFPEYDTPVLLPIFPAAYGVDLNNTGGTDLIIAPNSKVCGKGKNNILVYKDVSQDEEPFFTLISNDFLINDMIDLHWGASPAFADINGNGLLDMVIGNYNLNDDCVEWSSRLFLFENIGTTSQPAFRLIDSDYLGFSQFSQGENGSFDFAPHFADIDGDDDLDLIVGEFKGQLFFAENIAGPGNPVAFGPIQYGWMGIEMETTSVPYVYDINNDGLPDLIIGDRRGEVRYFQNIGTPGQPFFNSDPFEEPNIFRLGNMTTRGQFSFLGMSAPAIVYEEGIKKVVLGSASEGLCVYEFNEDLSQPFIKLTEDPISDLHFGNHLRPAFADLTGDGYLEMIVGNRRGGLNMYRTNYRPDTSTTSANEVILIEHDWQIFPNPTVGDIRIKLSSDPGISYLVNVLNVTGQTVYQRKLLGRDNELDLKMLPSGIYFVYLDNGVLSSPRKIIIR
jgi:hypothetical protein